MPHLRAFRSSSTFISAFLGLTLSIDFSNIERLFSARQISKITHLMPIYITAENTVNTAQIDEFVLCHTKV